MRIITLALLIIIAVFIAICLSGSASEHTSHSPDHNGACMSCIHETNSDEQTKTDQQS